MGMPMGMPIMPGWPIGKAEYEGRADIWCGERRRQYTKKSTKQKRKREQANTEGGKKARRISSAVRGYTNATRNE